MNSSRNRTDPRQPIRSRVGKFGMFLVVCSSFLCIPVHGQEHSAATEPPRVDDNGTVHVPSFVLPESTLLSSEARAALRTGRKQDEEESKIDCPSEDSEESSPEKAPAIRKCWADWFHNEVAPGLLKRFQIRMTTENLAGVYVEVFTPIGGVAPQNQARVLINLHGGGFFSGSRMNSLLESIPVASLGKIRVISVDYREAPEFSFPSAVEDVTAVYRQVLKTYKPGSIGIYGCSAGGLLTAEAMARFEKERLPLPGAAAMLCEGAGYWGDGDSPHIVAALSGDAIEPWNNNPYFKGTDRNDPLVFPIRSTTTLAKFPPTLLTSGTRDFALSSVVATHAALIACGVDAELHVWEGMSHAFIYNADLPEAEEAYSVIARFFEKHLER